ncbi:MAG: sugar ABC transporter substrate-binding protein [Spirochaetales bacterium]|nr:sugar ABC transporter substrate-binding protein [Spirochaetales bacterium]MCF7939248.1 sugar ABC transporter substrate-binding protein [Spirochaetales bacterium]
MKRVVIVLLCLSLVAGFVMAGGQQEKGEDTVVLLNIGMQSPYPPLYADNLEKNLNEAGIEMFMFDGKFDAQLQSSQMDDAIAMDPNAIVLFPVDSAAMHTAIKKAYDAGIPVIMGNGQPVEKSVEYTTLYFGPNNYEEGKVAGNVANEILGSDGGNAVIVEGATGQDASVKRTEGFEDAINSNIKVLAAQPADWVKDKAVRVMSDFLTSYGDDIDVIWSHSDDMGAGVGIALEEAGYEPGEIPSISLGGSKAGMESIQAGWITNLIIQSPIDETDQLAPYVIKVVEEGWEAGQQWDPYWNFMETPVVDVNSYEPYLPGF